MASKVTLGKQLSHRPRLDQGSIQALPASHRVVFCRALNNILSTTIAESTFAQIIDGLPISDVEKDHYDGTIHRQHPLHESHKQVSSDTLLKAHNVRPALDGTTLQFDAKASHICKAVRGGLLVRAAAKYCTVDTQLRRFDSGFEIVLDATHRASSHCNSSYWY